MSHALVRPAQAYLRYFFQSWIKTAPWASKIWAVGFSDYEIAT